MASRSALLMVAPSPARRWKVLLVDDTEDLRFIMRRVLHANASFEVAAEAENGAEGVEQARRTQPDVVLLDLLMPVMDGWEALPRIKAAAPKAKIVVVSGQDRNLMERRALEQGAVAYIEKGTPPGEIVRRLARVMGE